MGRRFALAFSLLGCALSSLPHPVTAGGAYRQYRPGPPRNSSWHWGRIRVWSPPGCQQSLPEACPRSAITGPSVAEGILSILPLRLVGSDEMGPGTARLISCAVPGSSTRCWIPRRLSLTSTNVSTLLPACLGDQDGGASLEGEIRPATLPWRAQAANRTSPSRSPSRCCTRGHSPPVSLGQHLTASAPCHPGGRHPAAGPHGLQAGIHRIPHRDANRSALVSRPRLAVQYAGSG